jgi:hypothetical protein
LQLVKDDFNMVFEQKPDSNVRRRERRMVRFKSERQCQCFVSTHGQIAILING